MDSGKRGSVAVHHGIAFDPGEYSNSPYPAIEGVQGISKDIEDHYRAVIITGVVGWDDDSPQAACLLACEVESLKRPVSLIQGSQVAAALYLWSLPPQKGARAFVDSFMKLCKESPFMDNKIVGRAFGFTGAELVRTPSWPLIQRIQSTVTRWAPETVSRHIRIFGLPNKHLKSVLLTIAKDFNTDPSDLFDEVYAVPNGDKVLTYGQLENRDLESEESDLWDRAQRDEGRAAHEKTCLHLVLYSMSVAIKIREYIEDELLPNFVRNKSLALSFDHDPSDAAPVLNLSIIYDSPTV